jgi:hypothetical protein
VAASEGNHRRDVAGAGRSRDERGRSVDERVEDRLGIVESGSDLPIRSPPKPASSSRAALAAAIVVLMVGSSWKRWA